jgi:hypothetical protein
MPQKDKKQPNPFQKLSDTVVEYLKNHMSGQAGDAIRKHNEALKQTLYEIDHPNNDESKKRKR